jgi:ABC-type multidrug transport system ATPase subunit
MVIDVQNLVVVRGGKKVIKDVTCGVPKGRIVGLIGPSGSGKTTLMRSIIGAQKIKSGSVKVLDMAAGSPELRHQVGYMAQAPSIYSNLTVYENVRYFSQLLGLPKAEVQRVVDVVELGPQLKQEAATLSGGQLTRVNLAIALLGTPPVLVLDEPTVGLDPLLRKKLWELFDRLAGAGATLLISSHVMDEAARCGELMLVRGGEVIAQGSAMTLLDRAKAKTLEEAFITLAEQQEDKKDV